MSYDYSSESKRLELPNPYKIDNFFLLVSGAVLIVCGVLALFMSREHLMTSRGLSSIAPLVLGIVLLVFGIAACARAMRRLRFFFGRGLPVGLAQELPPSVIGKTKEIEAVMETVRQGGLQFEEPKGAINGLLYNWIPQLIVAPPIVQALAQKQFHNALVLAALLAAFLIAWVGFGASPSFSWVSLFFFAFSFWLVLRPISRSGETPVGEWHLIALIVATVIGPVAVGYVAPYLPDIAWLSLNLQTLLLQITMLGAVAVFFFALLRQLGDTAPSTTTTCEQLALNINTQPALITGEFDRLMQQRWTEKIPNRRYVRIDPEVDANAKAGIFRGEIVEETQPMPTDSVKTIAIRSVFSQPRYRWLAVLDLLGCLLACAAAALALVFVATFDPQAVDQKIFPLLSVAAVLGAVAAFCFKAASALWGRFDFVSDFIWVELGGSYTTARVGSGNNFTHMMNTQSDVIKIDAMTMRVWMARLETVVFGKDARRRIVAMWGAGEEAKALAAHLAQFARSQSMVLAPTSEEDLRRIAALGALEKVGRSEAPSLTHEAQSLLGSMTGSAQVRGDAISPMAASTRAGHQFCSECGGKNAVGAKFCSACGKAMPQPA